MIPIVDPSESNSKKDKLIDRKCCRCGTTTTYTDKKSGVAAWRKRKINGKWDGENYYCDSCHHKLKRKCRNKEIEKNSRQGKGFRIEQVIAKTLGIKNCNIELDNFNVGLDLYDPTKYKDIQSRSAEPSIRKSSWNGKIYEYDVWHFPIDPPEYDTYFAVCMTENYKDIERIYVIPADKLPVSAGLTIYKEPKNPAWYEKYRIDESPFNETYHSLKIEDCSVIANEQTKTIKNDKINKGESIKNNQINKNIVQKTIEDSW